MVGRLAGQPAGAGKTTIGALSNLERASHLARPSVRPLARQQKAPPSRQPAAKLRASATGGAPKPLAPSSSPDSFGPAERPQRLIRAAHRGAGRARPLPRAKSCTSARVSTRRLWSAAAALEWRHRPPRAGGGGISQAHRGTPPAHPRPLAFGPIRARPLMPASRGRAGGHEICALSPHQVAPGARDALCRVGGPE